MTGTRLIANAYLLEPSQTGQPLPLVLHSILVLAYLWHILPTFTLVLLLQELLDLRVIDRPGRSHTIVLGLVICLFYFGLGLTERCTL